MFKNPMPLTNPKLLDSELLDYRVKPDNDDVGGFTDVQHNNDGMNGVLIL